MLAALLDTEYVGFATKLDVEGNTASLVREIEGGEEHISSNLPLVVSCQKGMAEQRIPNMRGIMAARTKPLAVVSGTGAQAQSKIVAYEMPATKTGVKMIDADNMDQLVQLLHAEAKVI